jgi:hypothetical protein
LFETAQVRCHCSGADQFAPFSGPHRFFAPVDFFSELLYHPLSKKAETTKHTKSIFPNHEPRTTINELSFPFLPFDFLLLTLRSGFMERFTQWQFILLERKTSELKHSGKQFSPIDGGVPVLRSFTS